MTNKINIIIAIITVLVVVVGFFIASRMGTFDNSTVGGGPADSFASCIAESGALFYGAHWCPACNTQKQIFGESESLLPYVECSLPGQRTQTIECRQENIAAYPTWKFADGTTTSTVLSFERLAELTGCQAPQI